MNLCVRAGLCMRYIKILIANNNEVGKYGYLYMYMYMYVYMKLIYGMA